MYRAGSRLDWRQATVIDHAAIEVRGTKSTSETPSERFSLKQLNLVGSRALLEAILAVKVHDLIVSRRQNLIEVHKWEHHTGSLFGHRWCSLVINASPKSSVTGHLAYCFYHIETIGHCLGP